MLGLTRSFRDWRGHSFRAVKGMLLRGTPLHSASDRGSGRLDGIRGPRELEVICVHSVRKLTVRFTQKSITCASNICHRQRSHFQRVLVNSVPPHFMSSIVVSTIPYIGTMVKLDDSDNPFLILKHSYIQLQVRSMKFNGHKFLHLQQA